MRFDANEFRLARLRLRILRADAAAAAGVDGKTMYNWETGISAPPAVALGVLSRLYQVTPDAFFVED